MSAVDAAVDAQPAWAATPARERADILFRTYEGILARRDEFAALITAEMGKPLPEAQTEVDYGAGFFRWFAESAGRIHTEGQFGVEPGGNYQIAVSKRPVGPSLLITPWNFPLAMGARKIAPALAAGCTTILKPAELTPLTSLLLARVLEEAGAPCRCCQRHHHLQFPRRYRRNYEGLTSPEDLLYRIDTGWACALGPSSRERHEHVHGARGQRSPPDRVR